MMSNEPTHDPDPDGQRGQAAVLVVALAAVLLVTITAALAT